MNAAFQKFVALLPGGLHQAEWAFEGIGAGRVALLMLLATVGVWWGYRWAASRLTRARRRLLFALRLAFFLLLILLFARPVLYVTSHIPVRSKLLVLVDDSESMDIRDRRTTADDRRRAALVTGVSAKAGAASLSRTALVQALADNRKLRFWDRLFAHADLAFYAYDSEVRPLGLLDAKAAGEVQEGAARLLATLSSRGRVTATGDALRRLLDQTRGQEPAGILLISDGGSNAGSPPEEAAALARESGVPIYVYGPGIDDPEDIMVRRISGSRGVFRKERIEYTVTVRAPAHDGQDLRLVLKEGPRVVAEETIPIRGRGDQTFRIGYVPTEAGIFPVSASIEPEPGEASAENNSATTRLRVLDDQIKVLYLEQEPRWDFRYLLAALERDERLRVHCLMYAGDPVKPGEEGKPFLREFPATRNELAEYSVIVLGDVDPAKLGEERMRAIRDWVTDLGGAVIFLAGRDHNPSAYAGTPLETLLPVEVEASAPKVPTARAEPSALVLTPAGEMSPMLRLSADPAENRRIWKTFPPVGWTARVKGIRPGAQVLVEDARQQSLDGLRPVVATMPGGQGTILYFGFDETYRWRSRVGEKYYIAIWNQIIQRFAIERTLALSPRIQLRAERDDYAAGETVRISGRIFDAEFHPLPSVSVAATLAVRNPDGTERAPQAVRLAGVPGRPGEFRVELEAPVAGTYTLRTELDPVAGLTFEVRNDTAERNDTALDAPALRALAQLSGGAFFREEDLDGLPDLVRKNRTTQPVVRKIDLAQSSAWLVVLLLLVCGEWFLRRFWYLK